MHNLVGITKMEAARRQFDAAICLYFRGDDPVAVLSLVAASSRILSDLAEQNGGEWWDRIAWEASGIDRRRYFEVMRKDETFLRHADEDPQATLDVNLDEIEGRMFLMTLNAGALGSMTPTQEVFQLWHIATRPDLFAGSDYAPLRDCAEGLFPAIHVMSRVDKLAFGLRRVHELAAGTR